MKHTKPVTLVEAMERKDLTQLQLEELSGVDRTRISKLCREADLRVLHDTYIKLEDALRRCGALKASEQLVFGPKAEALAL